MKQKVANYFRLANVIHVKQNSINRIQQQGIEENVACTLFACLTQRGPNFFPCLVLWDENWGMFGIASLIIFLDFRK